MSALPRPVSSVRAGTLRALDGRRVRVDASACPQILPAASALAARAYGIELVDDRDRPDVRLSLGPVPAPPAQGADPRPAERAGISEAYRIEVAGSALQIVAAGEEGLFRALTTLLGACDTHLPALRVHDAPAMAWRGLSLDVSRRWFPVDEVERIIDLLALVKMNVLHLHLTDTQAWRFPVPGYAGAEASDHYTTAQLRAMDAYARERFVTIVPEVDVPGHVATTLKDAGVPVCEGAHPILAYLDSDVTGTTRFLQAAFDVLAEAMSGPWMHIGGDEALGAPDDAYHRTVREAVSIVRGLGRRPLGWQEAIRSGALDAADLVQLWISDRDRFDAERLRPQVPVELYPMLDRAQALFDRADDDPELIVAAGAGVILSASDPFYLDRRPAEESTDPAQRSRMGRLGNPGYPPMPTTSVLEVDPIAAASDAGLPVAGIEAALWCESVQTFDDAATLLLPRLALIAQRGWGEASRDEVLAAAREDATAWRRLGFTAFHRSSEIFGAGGADPHDQTDR